MHQTNLGLTWKRKANKINFNSQDKIMCVRIQRWKLLIEKCSHLSESLPTRRLLINEKLQQVWSSFCFLARKYGRIFFPCNFQFFDSSSFSCFMFNLCYVAVYFYHKNASKITSMLYPLYIKKLIFYVFLTKNKVLLKN